MYKKIAQQSAMLLLALGILGSTTVAFSETFDNDTTEATAFFKELIQQTDNPVIARMAKENLKNLDKPTINTAVSYGKTNDYQLLSTVPVNTSQIKDDLSNAIEVPLLKGTYSRNLVVPALLNKGTIGTFIVDTGATYTVITPQIAKEMGVTIDKSTPRMSILTANGWIQAPVITIQHMSLGDVQIDNVQAVVQDLGGDPHLSGLLGMNFFKDIELTIRHDKLILRISANP